jgi:hypothetical protein
MKEISIVNRKMLGDFAIEDPPLTKRVIYDCKTVEDLMRYFNKDSYGLKLRDRKNLRIVVDMTGCSNDGLKSDLERSLKSIPWAKANTEYISPATATQYESKYSSQR